MIALLLLAYVMLLVGATRTLCVLSQRRARLDAAAMRPAGRRSA